MFVSTIRCRPISNTYHYIRVPFCSTTAVNFLLQIIRRPDTPRKEHNLSSFSVTRVRLLAVRLTDRSSAISRNWFAF